MTLPLSRKSCLDPSGSCLFMGMLERVFSGWMSFRTKPARIMDETLDLVTSSTAVEFCLRTSKCIHWFWFNSLLIYDMYENGMKEMRYIYLYHTMKWGRFYVHHKLTAYKTKSSSIFWLKFMKYSFFLPVCLFVKDINPLLHELFCNFSWNHMLPIGRSMQ